MPDEPQRGLFFPGEEAAAVAAATPAASAPPSAAAPRPAPVDPSLQAAAETLSRPKKSWISRRMAIRWAGWGSILLILAGWGNGFLGFFYPRKTGAFGGTITAGTLNELAVGAVKAVTDGKFYLVRVPEGFLALWWKCPHLGCTVPWKDNDPVMEGDTGFADKGRFNCPCHGSIYNRYGQIITGPAPRPMDRFPVVIEGDRIRVETGPTKAIVRDHAGPEAAVSA
jgi:cytochrome b6-f complex iron-sulfur subunit